MERKRARQICVSPLLERNRGDGIDIEDSTETDEYRLKSIIVKVGPRIQTLANWNRGGDHKIYSPIDKCESIGIHLERPKYIYI